MSIKQFQKKVDTVVRNVGKQRDKVQELVIEAADHFIQHNQNAEKLTALVNGMEPEPRWQAAIHTFITAHLAVRYDSKNGKYKVAKKKENYYEEMQQIRWDKYSNEQGTGHVKGFEPQKSLKAHYRKLLQDAAGAKMSSDPSSDLLEKLYASQAADIRTVIEYQGGNVPTVKHDGNEVELFKDEQGHWRVTVEGHTVETVIEGDVIEDHSQGGGKR